MTSVVSWQISLNGMWSFWTSQTAMDAVGRTLSEAHNVVVVGSSPTRSTIE